MKLVDVKAVYPKYTNTAQSWREYFWQIIVRVETDCGVIGWGYGGGGRWSELGLRWWWSVVRVRVTVVVVGG